MLQVAGHLVGVGLGAQGILVPIGGRVHDILAVLRVDGVGVVLPAGDVAALDLPGQGARAVFRIVGAGAEGGAQGADDQVLVLHPQGHVLVDVLHGAGPKDLAGHPRVGLIEFGDEPITGDVHSGHGVAVFLPRRLHAVGHGFQRIHDRDLLLVISFYLIKIHY